MRMINMGGGQVERYPARPAATFWDEPYIIFRKCNDVCRAGSTSVAWARVVRQSLRASSCIINTFPRAAFHFSITAERSGTLSASLFFPLYEDTPPGRAAGNGESTRNRRVVLDCVVMSVGPHVMLMRGVFERCETGCGVFGASQQNVCSFEDSLSVLRKQGPYSRSTQIKLY